MNEKQKKDFATRLVEAWAWDTIIVILILYASHLLVFLIKDYIDVAKISLLVKDFTILIFIALLYFSSFLKLIKEAS